MGSEWILGCLFDVVNVFSVVSWVLLVSSGECYCVLSRLLRCSEWFVGCWCFVHCCMGPVWCQAGLLSGLLGVGGQFWWLLYC